MTQVSRKGFVDKNGQKTILVPAPHSHDSIVDRSTNSSVSVSDGVVNITVKDQSAEEIKVAEIDAYNIDNLKCSLLGLGISFVRDVDGVYTISSQVKVLLNELLTQIPEGKCVPCVVHTQWLDADTENTASAEYPGSLCRKIINGPGIPQFIYLSFAGNYFYVRRTYNNDFPNYWTKFENPFVIDPAFNAVPMKSSDAQSEYSDDKLITSGAVKEITDNIEDTTVKRVIKIYRNSAGTSFPITDSNEVMDQLEEFVQNYQEGKTFVQAIDLTDDYSGKFCYPIGTVSWARRQMTNTKIDVVVHIGAKKLTATATVPADSLESFTWESEWDFKNCESILSIVSNS